MDLDVAQVRALVLAERRAPASARRCSTGFNLDLLLGEPQQQALLGAHLVGQRAEPLGQRQQIGVGGDAALLAAAEDALQTIEAVGGLLEQRLDDRPGPRSRHSPEAPPPESRV